MKTWDDFDRFNDVEGKYLPRSGEGETKATQAVTATTKLIYKWFNDGDVYDNVNSGMDGWYNDLSSYANWLACYIPETEDILKTIFNCYTDDDYTDILYKLASFIYDEEKLDELNKIEKVGSIYKCKYIFEYNELR